MEALFWLTRMCWTDECACGVGTLNLDVPDYVELVQSAEDKTAMLSVRDPNAKDQKEMWGTLSLTSLPLLYQLRKPSVLLASILNPG